MLYRRFALLLAFILLSANLLSVDFDGGAFEGKGIETAVVYFPSSTSLAAASRHKNGTTLAANTALQDGRSESAFEVPFTLISKHAALLLHTGFALPAFRAPQIDLLFVPLACLSVPRSPPRPPTDLRSFSLRAPPRSLTPTA